jgi:DNA invertase Pin-like site-specific DNA recombinase
MSDAPLIRAAQYLRMSTEHQRYSLANQAAAIAGYAKTEGFELVRSYFDPGKSGLTLRQRKGLQALLADALSPSRNFDAILVLDVSRWGRFQDADQPAYYEFLCREAGLSGVYCAEPFANDGSAASAILKQIKRVMAAEFSRELGEKVRMAHRLHAELGHHQGGTLPYGFRRMAVDAAGRTRGLLAPGHWKSVSSDHVVLVAGPDQEKAVIRWIFRQYVKQGSTIDAMVEQLNATHVPTGDGGSWSYRRVHSVLTNEVAIGNYVFGKTTSKLKSCPKRTSPDERVRTKIFDPIVSPKLFQLAQRKRQSRRKALLDDEALLDGMRRLWREQGALGERLIRDCAYLPSPQAIRKHFGTLERACERIGYHVPERSVEDLSSDVMLTLLRQAYERHGRISVAIMRADERLPHFSRYRRRFGSLNRAYELAGLPYRERDVARSTPRAGRVKLSDADLLTGLRRLWNRDGFVSKRTVDADPELPGHSVYENRFRTWMRALEFAGLPSNIHKHLSAAARRRLDLHRDG